MILLRRVTERTLSSTSSACSLWRLSSAPRPTADAHSRTARWPRSAAAYPAPFSSFASSYYSTTAPTSSIPAPGNEPFWSAAATAIAAAATAAAVAITATTADPCNLEAATASNKHGDTEQDQFFTFGQRRVTPKHQKDRTYEPKLQNQCSIASVHASRGPRSYMEDEHYVAESGNFFAVFDGHGGGGVSEYLSKHFWDTVMKKVRAQPSFLGMGDFHGKDLPKAFREACASAQKIISGISKYDHVGSTAICVLLDANCIWSINVGDSRAVLSRAGRAVDLSTDHKPNTKAEQERIEKAGGKVSWFGWEDEEGEPVAGMGAWRVNGNLGVSRSFGDRLEFPYVIAEPEVEMIERNWMEDQFIILASDGLWDVFDSQEAVDFVTSAWLGFEQNQRESELEHQQARRSSDKRKVRASIERRQALMSRYLVEEALRRGTLDNTTAVVVWLR